MKPPTDTVPAAVADFAWRSVRGALLALALGAIAALGGRGLAQAGVSPMWIWLWAIAGFVAFVGGLSFWAVTTVERSTAVARPVDRTASPSVHVVDEDTVTYWYAAGLALLLNVLATGMIVAAADVVGYVSGVLPVGVVCNVAGYLVVIGALRQSRSGQIQDT